MSAVLKRVGATTSLPKGQSPRAPTRSKKVRLAKHGMPKLANERLPASPPIKRRKATGLMPKGQEGCASPSPQRTAEAYELVPKGQTATASPSPKKSATAIAQVPTKATLQLPARSPSQSDGANKTVPKGQTLPAPRSTKQDGAARPTVPKGQCAGAAHPPKLQESASERLPKGHVGDANPATPLQESANSAVPKGHTPIADPATLKGAGATAVVSETANVALSPHLSTIDTLRELHRRRQDFHRAEKSLTLQLKAMCRRTAGGDKDAGNALYTRAMNDDPELAALRLNNLDPFILARAHLSEHRDQTEKEMEAAAKRLPIVGWVKTLKGFGLGSLAAVIGEAGDLNNYPTHSHLWKRLGLAVIDGGRQRKVEGVDALKHGYCPSRRSVVWNIGACILKSQSERIDKETGEVKTEAGPLRKLYDARKEYELPKCEAIDADPKLRKKYERRSGAYSPKAHAHCRAQRYVEKRVIRELWKAWRAL